MTDLAAGGNTSLVDPAIHEHGSKLLFDEHGMTPYWTIWKQFDEALYNEDTFEAVGETWQLNHDDNNVKYWESGIAPLEEHNRETLKEYNIGVVATDDVREKKVNFQFRPAFPNAKNADTGEPIKSLPDDLPEGIRVKIDSANVEPEDTIDVLQELAEFLNIRRRYFALENVHPWSRTYNLAVYVRVDREKSEEHIVGKDELFENLGRLAGNEKGRGAWKWDNEKIVGHMTSVTMNESNLWQLYDGHLIGKLLKSYHMNNPQAEPDDDDPTTHPKLEVQYSTDYSEHGSVPWLPVDDDDQDGADGPPSREAIRTEIEEYLINALSWAGLPVFPDDDTYVADEYWTPTTRPDDAPEIDVHPDPIDDVIEQEREMAAAALAETDSTDKKRDVLRALTDGGTQHYSDVAEAAGTSTSTVYRAFNKFDKLIERMNGELRLADDVIRDRLNQLFDSIDRSLEFAEREVDKMARAGVDISPDSAMGKWLRRYGATVNDGYDGMEIKLQLGKLTREELRRILRDGFECAKRSWGVNERRFADADVTYYNSTWERMMTDGPVGRAMGKKLKSASYTFE